MSEERILYQTEQTGPQAAAEVLQNGAGDEEFRRPVGTAPLRLLEPDLSYYLAVRRLFDAAQIQASAAAQAVQAVQSVIQRLYGIGPNDAIDSEGFLHRQPGPAE